MNDMTVGTVNQVLQNMSIFCRQKMMMDEFHTHFALAALCGEGELHLPMLAAMQNRRSFVLCDI